jgi:hypothetical protein
MLYANLKFRQKTYLEKSQACFTESQALYQEANDNNSYMKQALLTNLLLTESNQLLKNYKKKYENKYENYRIYKVQEEVRNYRY